MSALQDTRIRLAEIVAEILATGEWGEPTLRTKPLFNTTYTAQIGHAIEIAPGNYGGGFDVTLAVTLWANEGNDEDAADVLYGHLSRTPGSLLYELNGVKNIEILTAGNVGERDEGPTGFLAADITLVVHSGLT